MDKLCVIFGAGECTAPRKKFGAGDLVIAADGGYAAATAFGLQPAVVIGDFDSGAMPTEGTSHIIKLNRDKDETDMLAAVKLGIRRGYKTFVLYGGVGGRLDHTVANLATLAYMNAFDARGFLVGDDSVATVITETKFEVPKRTTGTLSVFAYGGTATGVTEKGVKFQLDNAELTPDFPLGVSNEIDSNAAATTVSVKTGSLLVFFPRR